MATYKQKELTIIAWQYIPDDIEYPEWITNVDPGPIQVVLPDTEDPIFVEPFNYLVKTSDGEVFSCDPDVFQENYEIIGGEDEEFESPDDEVYGDPDAVSDDNANVGDDFESKYDYYYPESIDISDDVDDNSSYYDDVDSGDNYEEEDE